jgi:hypothetical protein
VPDDATTLEINFTLKPGSDVAGKVVDEAGVPIIGVSVHWGRGYDHRVKMTGQDGRFEFKGLKSKFPNDVYAVKNGYAIGSQKVDPKDSADASNVVITLKPELAIKGVVVDENGKPVRQARLQIDRQSDALQNAKTDRQGRFILGKLSKGAYEITILAQDFAVQESRPIQAGTEDARIVIRKAARISGQVIDQATGKPIKPFNVRLAWPKTGEMGSMSVSFMEQGMEFSSGDGGFTLPRGYDSTRTFRLIVVAPQYEVGDLDGVKPGVPATIRLKKSTPVTVHVTNTKTGADVANAKVRFYYCNRAEPLREGMLTTRNLKKVTIPPFEAKSVGQARHKLSGVGPGPWVVEALAPGYTRYVKILADGEAQAGLEIKMVGAGTLAGVLKTIQGFAAEEMVVSFSSGTETVEGRPNRDGSFLLKQVPIGKGQFALAKPGITFHISWPATTKSGETTEMEVDMTKFLILEGRITSKGKTVGGVFLNANGSPGFAQVESGPEGRYRLLLPVAGPYRVSVQSLKGKTAIKVEVKEKRRTLDISLITGAISGVVLDKDGVPLGYESVSALQEIAQEQISSPWFAKPYSNLVNSGSARIDGKGKFTITGLSAGNYRLVARDSKNRQTTVSDLLTLSKDDERIRDVRMSMKDLGSIEVVGVDATSGRSLDLDRVHLRGKVELLNVRRDGKLKVGWVPPGTYELYVSAKGYISARLTGIVIQSNKRSKTTVSLEQGGLLSVTLKRLDVPENRDYPRLFVKLKNVPHPAVVVDQCGYDPNTVPLYAQGGQKIIDAITYVGISPGDYIAALYYFPDATKDPAGRFDVRFKVEVGKTTNIELDEKDMQPYQVPDR